MSKYIYDKNYFKQIDSHDKAYWLGFLYADGSITRFYRNEVLKSMSLELTLQSNDKKHLNKLKQSLNSNVPIQHKIISNKYEADRIVINCTSMCNDLIKLGCVPCKSLILKFPSNDILNDTYIFDFIRGYFDGDGGVSYTEIESFHKNRNKKYKQYHYRCYFAGTNDFLSKLKTILNNNNINTSEVTKDARNNVYSLYIYDRENIEKFKSYIYRGENDIVLDRKYNKFNDIINNAEYIINKNKPL